MKYFLASLILIFGVQISFGQEIDFEGNWYRDIKGVDDFYTRYEFVFYTKDDVIKAKRRYDLIKQFSSKDEWEGIYVQNVEIGEAHLHWSSTGGFVYYFVYHTLRRLDFGGAFENV